MTSTPKIASIAFAAAVLLLSFLSHSPLNARHDEAPQADVSAARSLVRAGRFQEAIDACNAILLKAPGDGPALIVRAAARTGLRDYTGALADADAGLKAAAGNPLPNLFVERGRALRGLGRFEESVAAFTRAMELDAAAALPYHHRANSLYSLRRYEEALLDAGQYLQRNTSDPAGYQLRGLILAALGRYQPAERDMDEAIRLNGKEARYYGDRSMIYRRQDKTKEGLDDAERAFQMGANDAAGHNTRGLARMQAKDFAGALRDFDVAIERDPKTAIYVANKGRCYYYMGDLAASDREIARALSVDPANSTAFRYRAELREKQGQAAQARADAEHARQLNPQDVQVRSLAARLGAATAPAFGVTRVARVGYVSKTPDDATKDPSGDVLWKASPAAPVRMPSAPPIDLPPPMSFGDLPIALYNWSVTTAKEGMRVVVGPMTQEQEDRFEAKWAPYYDVPTFEVVDYLNALNPLLARFVAARSGFVQCAQEAGKALHESAVLSEAGKAGQALASLDAARSYKTWMDGYEAAMRLTLAEIEQLGPMPNPYAARRARAKRFADEVARLTPVDERRPAAEPARYFVLVNIDRQIPNSSRANMRIAASEGLATMSGAGKMWFVEKGTMSVDASATWTPLPRIIKVTGDLEDAPVIELSATASVGFNGVSDAEITGLDLRKQLGIHIHAGNGQLPTDGDVCGSAAADGNRPGGKGACRLLLNSQVPSWQKLEDFEKQGVFVTTQTPAGNVVFRYDYKLVELTAEQAADIAVRGREDIDALAGQQAETRKAGEENAAKAASLRFLMDSRQLFQAERARALQDLTAATPANQQELMMRVLYADAQMHATDDNIQYAQTGQWVRTRTLYDDQDLKRMIEIGREEAARIALPGKALKAAGALIQQAPEVMRENLRHELRLGITADMMRGRNPDGLRALVASIGGQVQDYWTKEAGRESFKATLASVAVEGTKIGAGVAICGAGSVYVAGLGVAGWALWGADTLIGAAYGGVSGYVEGGPDEACRKSLEWAGLLGFTASTVINTYGEGADASAVIAAGARAVVLAKVFEYAAGFVGGFFAKPTVQEQFALARFQQEMQWAQSLIQRSQRAEAALASAAAKQVAGPALAAAEREVAESVAAINGSWHAKTLLKYGGDEATGQAFVQRVEALYKQVMPDFLGNLKAMGYDTSRLQFEATRNASSAGTVGLDLDLALRQTPGQVITKNGRAVSMATFQHEAQQAYNRAYFARTGYSAEQSLINLTTSAHVEAFTQGMRGSKDIPMTFESLTRWDRQRAGEVLVAKTSGTPLEGFTQAAEASRAIEKELRLRVIPDLRKQVQAALRAGNKTQADRLAASAEYWERIRTRTAVVAEGEKDAYKLWGAMQEIKGLSGGKDVFEVARTLAGYWPALGAWK